MEKFVQVAEEGSDQIYELPLQQNDGSLLYSTLLKYFPKAIGLQYRTEIDTIRGVRLSQGKFYPPFNKWGSTVYNCFCLEGTFSDSRINRTILYDRVFSVISIWWSCTGFENNESSSIKSELAESDETDDAKPYTDPDSDYKDMSKDLKDPLIGQFVSVEEYRSEYADEYEAECQPFNSISPFLNNSKQTNDKIDNNLPTQGQKMVKISRTVS